MTGHVPDRAERQASGSAERVAAGRPAAIRGAAARTAASPTGTPLPGPFRSTLERSLGVDLATVRIHADPAPDARLRQARALAVTVGEDVVLTPSAYRPDVPAGRRLLAHEVTHVVQQRTSGVRPQFGGDDPPTTAETPEEPVWISVSLHGLTATSPGRPMPAGESSQRAYLRVVLHRIAPTATDAQLDSVLDSIATSPSLSTEGVIDASRVIPEGERFAPVTIKPAAFADVAAFLDALGVRIDLTADQRRILHLGVAADAWEAEGVATLRQDYPWYTAAIWRAQLDMHTQVLADAVAAEEAAPAGTRPAGGRDALLAQLRHPLDVLEATRRDRRLTRVPPGPETRESRDAAKTAGTWTVLWGDLGGDRGSTQEHGRILAIQFYWTAPSLYDAALTDHAARADFLRRMNNWLGRATVAVDAAHDYTQELIRDPGRFTDRPFPAHLEAVPAPSGDLRIVPAHAEHRYRFSVDFHDLFDAFGSYAYRWDVLGWRPEGGRTAEAIHDIEAGRTDAGSTMRDRHATHHSDVLAARLGRDLAHARADVERLAGALGPAAVTMAPEALALFELRSLSTAVRTLVDVVTLEHGAGVRERMIQLPGPGLWVIRAAAVPVFEAADEVHRAPSVAYIPVYALPQQELADRALAESLAASETADRSRREALAALQGLTGPGADPTLVAMVRDLEADPRLGSDRWAALAATQRDMEARLAEIRATLDGSAGPVPTEAQAAVLRAQRDALEQQVEQNRLLLRTHRGRVTDHPALATPQQLSLSFVSDDGQTVPLAMEFAEQTRAQTSVTVTATAPAGSRFAVLSDHTTTNAGIEEAAGPTLDRAVQNAVTSLLESRNGYGRGVVAMRLPSGRQVSFRIEASLGPLVNEALDSATTLITVAALAAAPFTAGASLTILVPVGIVAGVRAAERMYTRYDASTLRWDMQTLQDFVDIAGAVVGVSSLARGAEAGMQVTRLGRIAAISFDVAQNVTGFIILGVGLQEQLRAIDATPGLSDGERRSRRMMALGGALVAAGMQAGTLLITNAYGGHGPGADDARRTGAPPPDTAAPVDVPPAHVAPPADVPPAHAVPPTDVPGARTAPPADVPPAHTAPPSDVVPPRPRDAAPGALETHPAETHPADGTPPAPVVEGTTPTADQVPPAPHPAATTEAPSPPRPTSVDDLLTSDGHFRPEYPDLRQAWEAYADRRRTGGRDPLTPREWALSQTRGAPARRLSGLLPRGWRRGARAVYPGARPRAVALAVESPRPGTPVGDTPLRWRQRVVRTEELRPLMDNAGEQYWSFPDLQPGEVLILPNGSRVWIDPRTGAIVDSNPVGPSISGSRSVTAGEEAMFAAGDRSQAHVDAGTQRLHGATSPGLGGDAPYSIAGGPPRLNLVIENAGIEAWVRNLRDNAPPGVDYVFTTRTLRSPRGDLLSRSYSVAAIEGGRTTPIADFEVRMRGGGLTDADVEVPGWHVHPDGLERYGAPRLRDQPASRPPGGDVSVDIPRSLREAVGGGDARDPRPVSPLTAPLEAAQAARARLGALSERAALSPRTEGDVGERLVELDEALAGAEQRIATGSVVDPTAVEQLNAVVNRINELTRIRSRTDRLSAAELQVLARLLDRIAVR
ncbi:DUF4157 domain-containing protein [Cellulomonas sp. P24]|uniref:eCIS core domain-containing protein n=1 Tax=Cellulomonas sp. P24 TaxID=2885206 RepID=UPI00216B09B5|nr:DUF4157 domain-containing protein [Cellulomonas sp. P24]MCR6492641.1 DUF4157 domain-containing protein [Cellulomonas sp. P24]